MLVQNKGNRELHIGALLVPGLNRLSPAQEEAFKKSVILPYNQKLINRKEIEVVNEDETVKEEPIPLSKLSADEAIKLVKEMSDVEMLTQLKETESRVTVVRAIEAQLETLTSPPSGEEAPVTEEQE